MKHSIPTILKTGGGVPSYCLLRVKFGYYNLTFF